MRQALLSGLAVLCAAALSAPASSTLSPRPNEKLAPVPTDASDLAAILSPPVNGPGAGSIGDGPVGLQATVTEYNEALITEASWPVLSPDGQARGKQRWRIVTGTGNCCENYLGSTPRGRLFDFGGDYIFYTDDEGLSWKRVESADRIPDFGEGAIAVAPGGDIVGVAWNPYHGDRVEPFKYESEEETWYYTHTKLHQPFFDRQSLGVVPGPFTFAGTEYPYLVLLKGGWPAKDPWLVSFDGLNYFVPSGKFADQIGAEPMTGWLDYKPTPAHDWIQPHFQTRLAALDGGRAVSATSTYLNDGLSADLALFDGGEVKWRAFEFGRGALPRGGNLLTDSKGRLHYVHAGKKGIAYLMSSDGGRSWVKETVPWPTGARGGGPDDPADEPSEAPRPELDFRASGELGITAIAAHINNRKTGVSQDYVYRFSTAGSRIELTDIYMVGAGDLVTGNGVSSTDPRFDFATIAFLPDGRVALSFMDSMHRTPAIAIQR